MRQRLQKLIAQSGIASRRHAENLIQQGRVSVDGEVVTRLGSSADPETQDVRVDRRRLRPARPPVHLLLNKPAGYVTTRSDPEKRRTVMDLLPAKFHHLFPVGRLDMGSTGLLVLTNDGQLAQRVAHPSFEVVKVYRLVVRGAITERELTRARRGVLVDGAKLRLSDTRIVKRLSPVNRERKPKTLLRVELRQGRYRELRRLFLALGFPVSRLHRERIGGLSDKDLGSGEFRILADAELRTLLRKLPPQTRRIAKKAPKPAASRTGREAAPSAKSIEGRKRKPDSNHRLNLGAKRKSHGSDQSGTKRARKTTRRRQGKP